MRFDAQIPKVLGGYRLIRRLGRGGMAEVWLAAKVGDGLEKPWVVKVLLPEHTTSAKHRERFLAEIKTLASLNHGRIVAIHDFGDERGFLYLVMEYVDGVNLKTYVDTLLRNGQRLPFPAVLYILAEVVDALRHAHQRRRAGLPRGVIHRDVTPSNVMISSEGEVYLTDFGLARYEEEFSFEMFGTLCYVAPEQARGAACPQSDLFGVGGVAHYMITGEPPRRVSNAMELQAMLDAPPPPTGRDDVPELLERIRVMCLAPSLSNRFETAMDILILIEEYGGYQRCAMMLKEYHLLYFGPPRTGTTEALAMANASPPQATVKVSTPPPQTHQQVESSPEPSAADEQLTTFWQPPTVPPQPRLEDPALAEVPPEYRAAPLGQVEQDAPKIRRRPRREGSDGGEPPRMDPTEVLSPLFESEARPDTVRTAKPRAEESDPSHAPEGPAIGSSTATETPRAPSFGSSLGSVPSLEQDLASLSASQQGLVPTRYPMQATSVTGTSGSRHVPMPRAGAVALVGLVTSMAALGVALTRDGIEPKPQEPSHQSGAEIEVGQGQGMPRILPERGHRTENDESVALGSSARSGRVNLVEQPEPTMALGEPRVAGENEPTIPIVIIVSGIEGGEVELDGVRIPLDPIAHTSLRPGRYPLRWRAAQSSEWRDGGSVDVTPEHVDAGVVRLTVSPTDGAGVERRP